MPSPNAHPGREKIFTHLDGISSIKIYLLTPPDGQIPALQDFATTEVTIDIPANILNKINYVNSKIPNYINERRPALGTHTLAILNDNFYFDATTADDLAIVGTPAKLLSDDVYGIPLFGLLAYTARVLTNEEDVRI